MFYTFIKDNIFKLPPVILRGVIVNNHMSTIHYIIYRSFYLRISIKKTGNPNFYLIIKRYSILMYV